MLQGQRLLHSVVHGLQLAGALLAGKDKGICASTWHTVADAVTHHSARDGCWCAMLWCSVLCCACSSHAAPAAPIGAVAQQAKQVPLVMPAPYAAAGGPASYSSKSQVSLVRLHDCGRPCPCPCLAAAHALRCADPLNYGRKPAAIGQMSHPLFRCTAARNASHLPA